ncbi:MAG: hypothetical protein GX263_04215 [Firmicutes bacterium]|nr:hypothetical protein [Bacillota bacterium]
MQSGLPPRQKRRCLGGAADGVGTAAGHAAIFKLRHMAGIKEAPALSLTTIDRNVTTIIHS